jgi:alpha-acetolactate decarboxylase
MKKSIYIILFILLAMLTISCETKVDKTEKVQVHHAGALKTIMSGNITAVISLDSLSNKKNLYALGAMENLQGEIQVFNSVPYNSMLADSSLQFSDSYNVKASLLVYAEVEEWNKFNLDNIITKEDLEKIIFETAKANDINTELPFPFLLKGNVASLDWHVINWVVGDEIHTHKKHKEAGLNGRLINESVEILGFYSSKHKAIFTHHSTNMHLHFKTKDATIAGHVDDLLLNETLLLKLPKL